MNYEHPYIFYLLSYLNSRHYQRNAIKLKMRIEPKIVMVSQAIVLIYAFIMTTISMVRPKGVSVPIFISLIVMVTSIFLIMRRETYLPFLGTAAIPNTAFKDELTPDKANTQVVLKLPDSVPDGTKVVYWGAQPSERVIDNPMSAYKDFKNVGIATVSNHFATITFHCPARYKIPVGITLNRHIHYRLIYNNGLIGPVETHYVKC